MRNRARTRKPRLSRRLGSVGFFVAIPALYLFGVLFLFTLLLDTSLNGLNRDSWLLFTSGVILGTSLLSIFQISWLRVLIHEVKHGIVVLLSGNELNDMEVQQHTGHVLYSMYKDRTHFEPFIVLAPYFFPLLSLPTFIAALFFSNDYGNLCALLLGVMFSIDFITSCAELYPNQSDLSRVFGGFFFSAIFVGGAQLFWTAACALWVQSANRGFINALYLAVRMMERLLAAP